MGKIFSDKTEEGIRLIWLDYLSGRAREGFNLLEEAVSEGEADACYFLSRCFSGPQYVWRYLDFEEDDEKAALLIKESIRRGSAVGVLGAMRAGELTPSVRATMPFSSLREARDIVLEKAEQGHPFCQHMIANTYFWGDVLEIDEIDLEQHPNPEKMIEQLISECIPWYEKAIEGGLESSLVNLHNLYDTGERGIPKDKAKAMKLVELGASRGWPQWQKNYADILYQDKKYEDALAWFKRAAENGYLEAWWDVGYQYEFGQGVQMDKSYALKCYEKGMSKSSDCLYRAGRMYYYGKETQKDYGYAAQLLSAAVAKGNKSACGLLGECYLKGRGVQIDYAMAKSFFEEAGDDVVALNGLGEIYADGLGVPEDIKKGVGYLQKAAESYTVAAENLSKFKKNFFGKWVRR